MKGASLKRSAKAVWRGGLAAGKGDLTTDSRVLAEAAYSFPTRFGDERGTNPEELIAAAHAGCFSMAFAYFLGDAGFTPERIESGAEVSLRSEAGVWSVTGVHLDVVASVPGIADADLQRIAEQAKSGCLVSRLLRVPVTLSARLA
jgi:osmotically inducible protein OsmC